MTPDEFRMMRTLSGLTQPGFAQLLGVKRDAVAKAESPSHGPTRFLIRSLALILSEGKFRIAEAKMLPEKG